jgi:peptidoglycan/LPS O-acetylase OafA/YrhL
VAWRYLVFLKSITTEPPKFFGESWSLAVEEWFYLLFSASFFLLTLFARTKAGRMRAFVVATGLFLVVPTVLRFRVAMSADPQVKFWCIVVLRLDAIMYRVLLSFVKMRYPAVWSRLPRLLPLGLLGIAAAVALYHQGSHLQTATAFAVMPVGAACVLPFFERLGTPHWLVAQSVERLSAWSYSIYLANASFSYRIALWAGFPPAWSVPGLLTIVISWAAIVLVSAAVYRWYEKPAMDLRERFFR